MHHSETDISKIKPFNIFTLYYVFCSQVTIETLKGWLEQHRNIRQVFIYDRNPEVCRAVHSEMQRVFKDRCFSPPVQNVNVNKGKGISYLNINNS